MARLAHCKVCGKEFKVCMNCRNRSEGGSYNWRAVACSPECGDIYLKQVLAARAAENGQVEKMTEKTTEKVVEKVAEKPAEKEAPKEEKETKEPKMVTPRFMSRASNKDKKTADK